MYFQIQDWTNFHELQLNSCTEHCFTIQFLLGEIYKFLAEDLDFRR